MFNPTPFRPAHCNNCNKDVDLLPVNGHLACFVCGSPDIRL